MRILQPSVELIEEQDPFKKIELAGRTCYKSESNITDESSRKFVRNLIENRHYAMLEHAAFVFEVEESLYERLQQQKFLNCSKTLRYLVSGNLRALNEANFTGALLDILSKKYGEDMFYTSELHSGQGSKAKLLNVDEDLYPIEKKEHLYLTFKIVTDRGVLAEFTRHRMFSYAVESTRYVSYAKKGEIQVVIPAFLDQKVKEQDYWPKYNSWLKAMEKSEKHYMEMIAFGCTPQEARSVLPMSLKTEMIVTGNISEWKHFVNLRYKETTGPVHPDMKAIAEMIYAKLPRKKVDYDA